MLERFESHRAGLEPLGSPAMREADDTRLGMCTCKICVAPTNSQGALDTYIELLRNGGSDLLGLSNTYLKSGRW